MIFIFCCIKIFADDSHITSLHKLFKSQKFFLKLSDGSLFRRIRVITNPNSNTQQPMTVPSICLSDGIPVYQIGYLSTRQDTLHPSPPLRQRPLAGFVCI